MNIKELTREQCLDLLPLDFSFHRKPYTHQLQALVWASTTDTPAFFMSMGTGKTQVAIEWLRFLNINSKILIVTVNFPLAYNWVDEFKLNYPELKGGVLEGTKNMRKLLLDTGMDFYVINYEGLAVILEELIEYGWNAVIVDESRKLKNPQANRTLIMLEIGKRVKHKAVLSGLPTVHPLDIWSQYYFLDGGKTFGDNYYAFRNFYFVDENRLKNCKYFLSSHSDQNIAKLLRMPIWQVKDIRNQEGISFDPHKKPKRLPTFLLKMQKWTLKKDREQEFLDRFNEKCIRFTKEECLTLPEKVYQTLKVDMTKEQWDDYHKLIEREGNLSVGELQPHQLENVFIKFSQITGGFVKLGENNYSYYPNNPKVALMKDIIEDAIEETKVIIFHRFIAEGRLIEEELKKMGIKFASMRSEVKNTTKEYERFLEDESVKIMVAHPLSGGIGLNFTNSSVVIYFSNDYSIESRSQSEDRCHRIGQTKNVQYINLTAQNTIDEEIVKAHQEGLSLVNRMLNYKLSIKDVLLGKSLRWKEGY